MQFSHSRVDTFEKCPYKYQLRYIDKLKTLDDYEPQDALKLGTAVHTGIEKDVETAIKEYYNSYPVITDLHINEAIKLETMIKKARDSLSLENAIFEKEINTECFKGFIDMLVPVDDNVYDMYDFKYSNNVDKYMESSQLHIYKYYAEKVLDISIRKMYFVFIPKTMIRQKKTEDLIQFRKRLKNTLRSAEVQIKEVVYNADKVIDFMTSQVNILTCNDYIKNKTRLCDWCEYQAYCEKQEDLNMALPSTKRVEVEKTSKKKIWIYGQPYSGKTTFADQFPTPLNLNTDGNVKYVTMPRLEIKDEVTKEGRIVNRKFAWEVFKEAIADLEQGSDFETIVVDLLEDVYDHCRIKVCEDNGWDHESDDSFKAYDIVRSEFLRTLKRLLNLDYNIVLISHEDSTKDIMKKSGDKITSIQPNIPEKVAKKVAGMVDLVGRVVVDGNKRTINFKSDEVVFGGGRLQGVKITEIPLLYDALCEVYDEAIGNTLTVHQKKVEEFREENKATTNNAEPVEQAEQAEPTDAEPVRRTRRKREE